LLNYLSQRLGMQMRAVITGVEEFGIFAEGIELPAEGFIAVSSLHDDYYRFEAATHSLTGHRTGHQFRLGDAITVEIAHVDLARRELDLRLIGHEPARHRGSLPSKRAKAAQRPAKKAKRMPRNKARRRRRS
jgi:ribonuclease R